MSLRSIANLSFGRRRLVFAIRRKFTDLQALGKGHAGKLQASREPDFDTDCREYKILPPAGRSRPKTDLPAFNVLQGLEVGRIPRKWLSPTAIQPTIPLIVLCFECVILCSGSAPHDGGSWMAYCFDKQEVRFKYCTHRRTAQR
jgi:hypothetical protein